MAKSSFNSRINPYVPAISGSEIMVAPTIRVRTKHGRRAFLRAQLPPKHHEPTDLGRIAMEVFRLAFCDAEPFLMHPEIRSGVPRHRQTYANLLCQQRALQWLTQESEDLTFWAETINYDLHRIMRHYKPLYQRFIEIHGTIPEPSCPKGSSSIGVRTAGRCSSHARIEIGSAIVAPADVRHVVAELNGRSGLIPNI